MLPVEFAFELKVEVGKPIDIGRRRVIPIAGGTLEGPRIRARVLPGGADYQIVHEDGFTEAEARYVLETESGDFVYVNNRGMRHGPPEAIRRLNAGEKVDPALIYFRTVPAFETASAELDWITRSIFIGVGEREPRAVRIRFYRVL